MRFFPYVVMMLAAVLLTGMFAPHHWSSNRVAVACWAVVLLLWGLVTTLGGIR